MSTVQLYPPHLEAAVQAVALFDYGDIISKDWLLENFKIESPEVMSRKEFENNAFKFLSMMEAFKTILLEDHYMCLQSVKGLGYRIVLPKEQTAVTMSKLNETISRKLRRAVKDLAFVNRNLLEQEEIAENDEAKSKLAALSAFSRKRLL
jgi:hypothetical protein